MRDDYETLACAEITNDIMETYSLTLFLGGLNYGRHNKEVCRGNVNRLC